MLRALQLAAVVAGAVPLRQNRATDVFGLCNTG